MQWEQETSEGSFLLHGPIGQDSGIGKRVESRVIGGAGVNLQAPLQNVKLEFEKTPPTKDPSIAANFASYQYLPSQMKVLLYLNVK